ncbi:hypothetical protein CI109_106014 [Kwoniella shandongensis]|uniref:Uncharacterized protein n=1 Tax=Kwoniella shandongensis TaxID=1734106 RepID=A0A5M6BXU5_9TREE|nr:uncharacterized protein CI109_003937 [Kwoniella shandongensis]KAA5527678.1 hypothetical protein CI109_003937 [Kwoniella shandongensis]
MKLRHNDSSRSTVLSFIFSLLLFSTPVLADPVQSSSTSRWIYTSRLDSEASNLVGRAEKGKKPEYVAHPAGDLVCRPFGECSPCPRDELDQPFCLPFGNRRLLHCIPAAKADSPSTSSQGGEVPAWEACGKVIKKERQDYWEFVTANLLFLIVALTILWARTSALATEQYRQLAARIGIPGGGWVR